MKTFFKQLFCGHIWKQIRSESLWVHDVVMFDGITPKGKVKAAACTYRCLKCGKEKIEEEIIRHEYTVQEIFAIERAKRNLPEV